MLKILCAGWCGLSPATSSQFTLKMCAATKNCQKFTKKFKVIDINTAKNSWLVLLMIRSSFVSICNCFYARQANSGKITTFQVVPFFDASVRRSLWTSGGSGLKLFTFNAKSFISGYLGLSPAIVAQFALKMCVTAQNQEKFIRTLYFRGLISFKIINVDTLRKLVNYAYFKIRRMFMHICNCFTLDKPTAIK